MSKNFKPKSSYLVKGVRYRVLVTDELVDDDQAANCSPSLKEIRIRPSLQGDELKIATIHELCHGLFKELHLDQTCVSDDAEQIIAEGFATFMVKTFDIKNKK